MEPHGTSPESHGPHQHHWKLRNKRIERAEASPRAAVEPVPLPGEAEHDASGQQEAGGAVAGGRREQEQGSAG